MIQNSLVLLNDIILKIHTTEDFESMRMGVLSGLDILIPGTGASFYLASKTEQYKLTNPVNIGVSNECTATYTNEFQDYDRTTWTYATPYSKVFDDSDFIQNEANHQTEFYRRIYGPYGIYYQITLTISHNGVFLGVVSLFRNKEEGPFHHDDIFFLELISAHLAVRLYHGRQSVGVRQDKPLKLEVLIEKYHLTLRETEVLYAMLGSAGKGDLCSQLCISPNTLKKHVVNIYKKFQVNGRIELYQKISQIQKG